MKIIEDKLEKPEVEAKEKRINEENPMKKKAMHTAEMREAR